MPEPISPVVRLSARGRATRPVREEAPAPMAAPPASSGWTDEVIENAGPFCVCDAFGYILKANEAYRTLAADLDPAMHGYPGEKCLAPVEVIAEAVRNRGPVEGDQRVSGAENRRYLRIRCWPVSAGSEGSVAC